MSDPAPPDPGAPLQFDQVELPGAARAIVQLCGVCKLQITDTYYEVNGAVVCPSCSEKLMGKGADMKHFPRALLYGAVTALAGTIVWYLVGLFGVELAIIAIAVGYFVGRSVRLGSGGRGGWQYQALAICLTYASICASYVPDIRKALPEAPALVVARLAVEYPFLGGFKNAMGIIIIGIALYEAWKLNRRIVLSGPFRVVSAGAPAAGAPAGPAAGSP